MRAVTFQAPGEVKIDERPSPEFPLLLTTGRVANQWHTRTKTALVPALNQDDARPSVHMHPADAEALFLRDGQQVTVRSPRGAAATTVQINADISPGLVWMPIHWNDLWAQSASPNESTSTLKDPISKQPALKAVAVTVTPVFSEPAVMGPGLAEAVSARGGHRKMDPEKQSSRETEKTAERN